MNNKIYYIFVDEAGNFDFSNNGTKYFVLSSFTTLDPIFKRELLMNLKYSFWNNDLKIEYFHASEDKYRVRNEVFKFINNLNFNIEIDSVIIQKNKLKPELYINENKKEKGKTIYQLTLRCLLKYIFNRFKIYNLNLDKIIVILSSIFDNNKRELILKTTKKFLKENFKIPFQIYFFDSKSDLNCQIIDYICWAIYRKWENKDLELYNLIKEMIKSEFNMFEGGNEIYY